MYIFCNLRYMCIISLSICLGTEAQDSYEQDYLKREHSLTKPYQGAGISLPFWDYQGSAMITSNYVRLTADLQSKKGAIWNQMPCMTKNWVLYVQYKVHGKGKELFGDGFVLWYAKDRMIPGPVFGSKDYFSGLAIIFDTYSNHNGPHNHQHPYISAMVNNGSLTYDHDRDGTLTQLAGCEAKFRNVEYETHIGIRYENEMLTVSTDIEGKNDWKLCFSAGGVKLPTGYYFGASAETGDLSDNHDIVSFQFYEVGSTTQQEAVEHMHIIPEAKTFEPPRPRKDDIKPGMSNIQIFLIILCGMILAVACAVFGIMFYQKHQENSRKLW